MIFKKHKIGVSGTIYNVKKKFNTCFGTCDVQYHWSVGVGSFYII